MKRLFTLCPALLFSLCSFAQLDIESIRHEIQQEGVLLYRSEMASWYGTDIFLKRYKDRDSISGYFSYTHNNISTCVFYSKGIYPRVIGTISFDSVYTVSNVNTEMKERDFTAYEKELYTLREKIVARLKWDTSIYKCKDCGTNVIPLVDSNKKRAYILCASPANGMVYFGNDYLISFNENNDIESVKRLHQNLIPAKYSTGQTDSALGNMEVLGPDAGAFLIKRIDKPAITVQSNIKPGDILVGAMHIHSPQTGDFITATDICTAMLYEGRTHWEQYVVYTRQYMNIWDCKKNTLTIVHVPEKKK